MEEWRGGRRERREAEVSKSRGAEGGWFCPQKIGSGGIARSKFLFTIRAGGLATSDGRKGGGRKDEPNIGLLGGDADKGGRVTSGLCNRSVRYWFDGFTTE